MEEKKKYLLKGDISGIQEFIFNIPSEGAARVLKARSFFIQAVTHLCLQKIKSYYKDEIEVISDSGGSFYLNCERSIENLDEIEEEINKELLFAGLYVILVEESIKEGFWQGSYSEIESKTEVKKQRKYNNSIDSFAPRNKEKGIGLDVWKRFTKNLSDSNACFNIVRTNQQEWFTENTISLFGYSLILDKNGNYSSTSFNRMPLWSEDNLYFKAKEEDIVKNWEADLLKDKAEDYESVEQGKLIDFDHLALQARLRTGTNKIGVAKMDVDRMGNFFTALPDIHSFQENSKKIKHFFSNELEQLWQNESFDEGNLYRDNILIVYAGGDDCFLVGGWDAVLYFVDEFQTRFTNYVQQHFANLRHELTLSAGVIIVNPEYPVIRIGQLAEGMLRNVKSDGKNGIALFDEKFSWSEYRSILSLTNTLNVLIRDKGESKALVQKIRLSAKGYKSLMNNIKRNQSLSMEKVWNLSWFILRGVKEENKLYVDEKIVSKYHDALSNALSSRIYSNALIYPFAARLAEFYNRKLF